MSLKLAEILALSPVVPVLVLDDVARAATLAQTLCDAGLKTLEITLRTPVALDCIRAMRDAAPEAVVGAGTILTPDDAERAIAAGAQFLVSPGHTEHLLDFAVQSPVPFLPGVSTASEAMRCLERGLTQLKLFPAEAVGGVALLKSLAGPLPQLRFCPTGGIDLRNAGNYLALKNVACIGGSWMAGAEAIRSGDWTSIATAAREAAALKRAAI